jgi:hypothetical protein
MSLSCALMRPSEVARAGVDGGTLSVACPQKRDYLAMHEAKNIVGCILLLHHDPAPDETDPLAVRAIYLAMLQTE